jgi:hypothetical protein
MRRIRTRQEELDHQHVELFLAPSRKETAPPVGRAAQVIRRKYVDRRQFGVGLQLPPTRRLNVRRSARYGFL